nr:MAG: diaminopimelate epimerase [Hyphomicrobiales bacterium]
MTRFLKMHGLGNDFVVFDAREDPLALDGPQVRAIADRRRGIGCDTVIVIENDKNGADAFTRFINADGGEVESCGNAGRCIARLLIDESGKELVRLSSKGGLMECRTAGDLITVEYGPPQLDWREIPMAQAVDTASFALQVEGFADKALQDVSAVAMGNPHLMLFVENTEAAPVDSLGPAIEHHAWFPARTNVEFVETRAENAIRMRVWERGIGITQACGTGACASVVAAHRRGLTGRKVAVELDGGMLDIEWRESDDHILMTGPTALSFEGEVDLAKLGSQNGGS